MKESLRPGIEHELRFRVPSSKTVPALYPEALEFQAMPKVFATGFLVGLLEWTCIQAVNPHIDWPREQTVGTRINVSHAAATPPGLEVAVRVKLVEVDGRRLVFEVEASDEVDIISRGSHERCVIDAERFTQKLRRKGEAAAASEPLSTRLPAIQAVGNSSACRARERGKEILLLNNLRSHAKTTSQLTAGSFSPGFVELSRDTLLLAGFALRDPFGSQVLFRRSHINRESK